MSENNEDAALVRFRGQGLVYTPPVDPSPAILERLERIEYEMGRRASESGDVYDQLFRLRADIGQWASVVTAQLNAIEAALSKLLPPEPESPGEAIERAMRAK